MSKMCFANKANKFRILKVGICEGKDCPFIKTKIQLKESVRKAYARIAYLDISKQNYIANKYYQGKYPWRKEGVGHNS